MGKKSGADSELVHDPSFPLTAQELSDIMRARGEEAVGIINQYGGIQEICRKLKTSQNEGRKAG